MVARETGAQRHLVTVVATATDNRVAFSEQNPAHPNGQAFVAGNGKQRQVANTPAVQRAIRAGVLVLVEPVQPPEPTPAAQDAEPWPGYDGMTAAEIIAEVERMAPHLRDHVRQYEESHKARKTVLEALWR